MWETGTTAGSHKGGAWKLYDRDGNRLGTYNIDLTTKIGD